MNLSRISSLILIIFSTIMYFFVIPVQTQKPVFAGYVSTETFPNMMVIGIALFALLQIFEKNQTDQMDNTIIFKSLFIIAVGILGAYLMSKFGFLIVAPLLSVFIMFFAGERRLPLLTLGCIVPMILWYCSVVLLDMPLP